MIELYPVTVRYYRIDSAGSKKPEKTKDNPFENPPPTKQRLLVSRATTIKELRREICTKENVPPHRTTLSQVIKQAEMPLPPDENVTLEELGLEEGFYLVARAEAGPMGTRGNNWTHANFHGFSDLTKGTPPAPGL